MRTATLRAAFLAAALAGASARAPAAVASPASARAVPGATTMTEGPLPLADLLRGRRLAEPFKLKVVTKTGVTFLKKAPFAWFEWVYGEEQDGALQGWSVGYRSSGDFVAEIEGKRYLVGTDRMRAFLLPALRRAFKPGDKAVPEPVRERMAQEKLDSCLAEEYLLAPGKTYHALVHEDRYHLPPEGPGERPREGRNRVLWVSDRPFKDGKAAGEMTPGYRGWSY